MSGFFTPTFAPGTEIAGHLVLAVTSGDGPTVRLRARDSRGRGSEVAVSVRPGADEAALADARHHAQRLAGLDGPVFCVPTDIRLTDHGLVVIRPWFESTLALGARAAGLSARRCIGLVIDLARALDEAHHCGLRHGAVGGTNIVIADDGRGRLVDAAATCAPVSDDTVALGAAATNWLGEFDEGPLVDLAREQCAAAARGRLGASELADRLDRVMNADQPRPDPPQASAPPPRRHADRPRRVGLQPWGWLRSRRR